MRGAAVVLRCLIAANWIGFAIGCSGWLVTQRLAYHTAQDLARDELLPNGNEPGPTDQPQADRYQTRTAHYVRELATWREAARSGW